MNKIKFLNWLNKKTRLFDGAMGTYIYERKNIQYSSDLVLKKPDLILEIHKEYIKNGAEIILTNTFGANIIKLRKENLENKFIKINKTALEIAKKAVKNTKTLIAADIGPIGDYIKPLGNISFEQAYENYKKQAFLLKDADLFFIETFEDILMLKSAIIAIKEITNKPIIASMTFQDNRTSTGTDIITFVKTIEPLNVDVIGINCSLGSKKMLKNIKILSKITNIPIIAKPNAGIPYIKNGKTIFRENPEYMAKYLKKFIRYNVKIFGGCCGTNPNHIKEFRKIIDNQDIKFKKIKINNNSYLTSRTKTIEINKKKTLIIGERINPTGRKVLEKEINQSKIDLILKEAQSQTLEGASILDINVSTINSDEKIFLPKVINEIQKITNIPLSIDTKDSIALENSLRIYSGKAIINSIDGTINSLKNLKIAKKYGASIIILPLDKKGVPLTAIKRIRIAELIIKKARKIGISKNDIFIDGITLTKALDLNYVTETIKTISYFNKKGFKTILGISNISHGMKDRDNINLEFLRTTKKKGLNLAIINPAILKQKQKNINNKKDFNIIKLKDSFSDSKKLYLSIINGTNHNTIEYIDNLINKKKLSFIEINEIMLKAMKYIGIKFQKKQIYLSQVLQSSNIMKSCFDYLKKNIKKEREKKETKILIATVKGDVHDIGKNIFKALLESSGYKVKDLGISIDSKKIVSVAKTFNPDIIGLSALMTTTVTEMESVIKKLREENIFIPVLCGGAIVTDRYIKKINGIYAKDVIEGIKIIKKMEK
jgi:5-methyltetrahydrofolate--homocysteine methyltransferase